MDKLTRRHFAAAVTVAGATNAPAAVAAQQAPNAAQDLLARRREAVARASDELRQFELQYANEPAFRLVVI